MKLRYIALIALLIMATALFADIPENAGEYGYQFLDISTNPVSLALSGRGIAAGGQLASFVRQPSSGALESHRAIGISRSLWLADTKYNNLYYSASSHKSHFGIALRNLDYGELEIRDDNGFLIGYYSPLNMDLMANYALRLTPSLYAGVNAGVAYEKLNTDSSLGIHTDLGVTLLPPFENSQISLSVRNLGLSSAMNDESTPFAPSFELDLSKKLELGTTDMIVEVSGLKAIDEPWKAAASTQLTLYEMFNLRLGYKINYDAENLSAGLGFRWKGISVDYGWAAFSSQLNDVHSLGISYHF